MGALWKQYKTCPTMTNTACSDETRSLVKKACRLKKKKKTESGKEEKHQCSWWSQSKGWTGRGIGKELNGEKNKLHSTSSWAWEIKTTGAVETRAEKGV